jgi:citrate synthase
MVDVSQAIDKVLRDDEVEALGLPDQAAEGLVYVGFLPAMLAYAVESGGGSGTGRLDDLLADPPAGDRYIDLVFLLCAGRRPAGTAEARLFEAIMVAFIGGFGYLTPTVMLPRMSAGTRAALPVTLAAGFAGAGPAHTGACELAMQHQAQVQALIAESSAPPLETARQQVRGMLEAEQRVPGFGHPLFRADPRIPRLREVIDEIGFTGEEIDTFELVARAMREEAGLHPNIDGIASAVFRAMGLNAAYGTGLFMCSRAGDMLAHVLEKLRQPPFGISSSAARKYLDSIPTGWI